MTRSSGAVRGCLAIAVASCLLSLAACNSTQAPTQTPTPAPTASHRLPQVDEPVTLDPADLTTDITNPYWPMVPGMVWRYIETDTKGNVEHVTVTVTRRLKRVANGITARVVRDEARDEDDQLTEGTDDWYAQDRDGNIWYLGEATAEYENGKVVSTAGSFEAGVDGAQPGIALPGHPTPGMRYRQEYLKGVAEDRGGVVTVGEERVEVPAGYYDTAVLMTRDLVPLEPRVQELKFYAPGVGPVLSVHLDSGSDGGRSELVSYVKPR